MSAVVHLEDIRLKNNAGMAFPVCYAGAKLLDLDKSGLPLTPHQDKATCKRCKKAFAKRYSWAIRRST